MAVVSSSNRTTLLYAGVGGATLAYCLLELALALSLDSLALLSDGFHNVSGKPSYFCSEDQCVGSSYSNRADVVALGIAWQAERLSSTHRVTPRRLPFGYARAELVGALINASG